ADTVSGVIIYDNNDATVDSGTPGTNYGTSVGFSIGGGLFADKLHSYVGFDMSSIPAGALITSAVLYLYCTGSSGLNTIDAWRIISSWSENTITWNTVPSTGIQINGISGLGATGWVSTDVTSLVTTQSSFYGIYLAMYSESQDNADYMNFASHELGGYTPYLIISYVLPPTVSLSAPAGAYAAENFVVSENAQELDGSAAITSAQVQLSFGINLNWNAGTGLFTKSGDSNNYCVLISGAEITL